MLVNSFVVFCRIYFCAEYDTLWDNERMAKKPETTVSVVTNSNYLDVVRDARSAKSAELVAAINAGAPEALAVVRALMKDTSVSAKVRADIGFKWLDRAGYVAPRAAAPKGLDIPLHEMSVNDLRDLAAQLGAEIADRATVVSAPNAPEVTSDVVDSLM